jgi:arsenate reductase (thioredoxin)
MNKKPSILFLSSHNSVRSQLAEALLRHLAGERFEVRSAGLFPQPVHAFTRRVLEESGINATPLTAKSVRDYLARSVVHVAIILCDNGPADPKLYPFAPATLRWRFEDPLASPGSDEEVLVRFRRLRDGIRTRLETWLVEEASKGAVLEESALA